MHTGGAPGHTKPDNLFAYHGALQRPGRAADTISWRGRNNDFNRTVTTDGFVCRKSQEKNMPRVHHGNRDRFPEWLNAVTIFVSSE